MRVSELELDLGTVAMKCTSDEVAETLAALLREMRSVIPRLRDDERNDLREIMSRESGTLTVGEVFPNFARESEGHKTLRRLRAAQFVRPAQTGRWDPNERIEIKPFARLMWDRVGEDVIFSGIHASPAAPAEAEVVDLGLADADANVEEHASTRIENDEVVDLQDVDDLKETDEPVTARKRSAAFEDNDVVDLGDDDLFAFAQDELREKS